MHTCRRALSRNQGQRYHSDIQHIYILHDRPLASSDSRTTDSVERFSDTLCVHAPLDHQLHPRTRSRRCLAAGVRRRRSERTLSRLKHPPRESRDRGKVEVVLTVFAMPILGHEFAAVVLAPSLHLANHSSPRDHLVLISRCARWLLSYDSCSPRSGIRAIRKTWHLIRGRGWPRL